MVKIINNINKNILIFPALVLAIILVLLIVTGNFLYQKALTIKDSQQKLSILKQDLFYLDKIISDKNASQYQINEMVKSLPASYNDVVTFVSQIERIATQSSQKIEINIAEKAIPETGNLASIKLSIKTIGSYNGFTKMISNFSSLPFHTKVDSILIEQNKEELSALTELRLFKREEEIK
ncbi:MAG: type 4a pilus biogenesis protein PilO [Candidatus Gottesmanbacteria bacterium]